MEQALQRRRLVARFRREPPYLHRVLDALEGRDNANAIVRWVDHHKPFAALLR